MTCSGEMHGKFAPLRAGWRDQRDRGDQPLVFAFSFTVQFITAKIDCANMRNQR
jgi:hypothetical protein